MCFLQSILSAVKKEQSIYSLFVWKNSGAEFRQANLTWVQNHLQKGEISHVSLVALVGKRKIEFPILNI